MTVIVDLFVEAGSSVSLWSKCAQEMRTNKH